MDADVDREQEKLLALAKQSPALVAVHDKAGWLTLFGRSASIEDPVGAAPHQRTGSATGAGTQQDGDPLDRFFETFIAPNEIQFQSSLDIVAGHEVARDVHIKTRVPNGSVVEVPAYLIYEIAEEADGLRVQRMAAHWDLLQMTWKVLSSGLSGLGTMTGTMSRMLRIQGLWGIYGFARGMAGIGRTGRDCVEKFAAAVRERDTQALGRLFTTPDAVVEWPVGQRCISSGSADFFERLPAGFRAERPVSSGLVTAFRCEFERKGATGLRQGIGFFHFDPASKRIARARFFLAD